MKSRKERKITKAFANIEQVNLQIVKLDKSYQQLVETYGVEHVGVKSAVIKLEFARSVLLAKKEQEQANIRELNK